MKNICGEFTFVFVFLLFSSYHFITNKEQKNTLGWVFFLCVIVMCNFVSLIVGKQSSNTNRAVELVSLFFFSHRKNEECVIGTMSLWKCMIPITFKMKLTSYSETEF